MTIPIVPCRKRPGCPSQSCRNLMIVIIKNFPAEPTNDLHFRESHRKNQHSLPLPSGQGVGGRITRITQGLPPTPVQPDLGWHRGLAKTSDPSEARTKVGVIGAGDSHVFAGRCGMYETTAAQINTVVRDAAVDSKKQHVTNLQPAGLAFCRAQLCCGCPGNTDPCLRMGVLNQAAAVEAILVITTIAIGGSQDIECCTGDPRAGVCGGRHSVAAAAFTGFRFVCRGAAGSDAETGDESHNGNWA